MLLTEWYSICCRLNGIAMLLTERYSYAVD